MAAIATIDGNGFAAVSGDLAGVLLVDPADSDGALMLEITTWATSSHLCKLRACPGRVAITIRA